MRTEIVGGVVEAATTYTPYGKVLEKTGTSGAVYGFTYGFTGEQEDSATELLYLRARYYSPYIEYERLAPPRGRGLAHEQRILANDPEGIVITRVLR